MPGSSCRLANSIPLRGQFPAQPKVAAHRVPLPDSQHQREQLTRLPDPLAQLARPLENRADFGRGITASGDVCGAQGGQKLGFGGIPCGGLQVLEQLQAPGQVADRFDLRRPCPRPQSGLQPAGDGLLRQTSFGKVVAEKLRLCLGGLGELRFQHLGDAPVELLALVLDQRVVEGIFEQGVLENIVAPGRPALGVEDLRLHQFGQLGLEGWLVQSRNGGQQFVAELAAEPRWRAEPVRARPPSGPLGPSSGPGEWPGPRVAGQADTRCHIPQPDPARPTPEPSS